MTRSHVRGHARGRTIARSGAAVGGLLLSLVAVQASADDTSAAPAAEAMSRYVAINPVRVMDTRVGLAATRFAPQAVAELTVLTPQVLAAAGLDLGDVTAVTMNLTSADASGVGYIAAWPGKEAKPSTSSLNVTHVGHVVANLVTIPVGPGGTVDIFTQAGGDIVVDVQGLYVRAATATAGRLIAFAPRRALDTRGAEAFGAATRRVVNLTGVGVPVDATAAVLTVTATESTGPGFFTVWPPDDTQPVASNLNVEHAGQTIANQVIAGLDHGSVAVYSSGGGHLVIDVTGYITGATSPSSADGLFVPLTPARVLDTRDRQAVTRGLRPYPSATLEVPTSGYGGVPATGVAAVALNLTLTQAVSPGFITSWPARTPRPLASVLNADSAGQTVSNHSITPVSSAGFSLFTQSGAHLVADVFGYWIGPPQVTSEPAPPPYNPLPRQPAEPPTRGSHEFIWQIGNSGARWDPCSPIRYVVNSAIATPTQRGLLDIALSDVTNATGIQFEYVGDTSEGHDVQYTRSDTFDAIFVFSDPNLSPHYLGGGRAGNGSSDLDSSFHRQLSNGHLIVDVGLGDGGRMLATLRHELGHMMGLFHTQDPNELMYFFLTHRVTYGPGDLEGLWWLGASQGCLPLATTSS